MTEDGSPPGLLTRAGDHASDYPLGQSVRFLGRGIAGTFGGLQVTEYGRRATCGTVFLKGTTQLPMTFLLTSTAVHARRLPQKMRQRTRSVGHTAIGAFLRHPTATATRGVDRSFDFIRRRRRLRLKQQCRQA